MKLLMVFRGRRLVTLGRCAGIVALLAPALASAGQSFLLHANEGNRQRRFDIDTIGSPPLLEDVFVERASAEEAGGNLVTTGQFLIRRWHNPLYPKSRFIRKPPSGWRKCENASRTCRCLS